VACRVGACLVAVRGTRIAQGDRDGGVGGGVGGGCRFSLGARRRRGGRCSRREYRDRPEGRPPAVYTSSVLSAATARTYTLGPAFRARSFAVSDINKCRRRRRRRARDGRVNGCRKTKGKSKINAENRKTSVVSQ